MAKKYSVLANNGDEVIVDENLYNEVIKAGKRKPEDFTLIVPSSSEETVNALVEQGVPYEEAYRGTEAFPRLSKREAVEGPGFTFGDVPAVLGDILSAGPRLIRSKATGEPQGVYETNKQGIASSVLTSPGMSLLPLSGAAMMLPKTLGGLAAMGGGTSLATSGLESQVSQSGYEPGTSTGGYVTSGIIGTGLPVVGKALGNIGLANRMSKAVPEESIKAAKETPSLFKLTAEGTKQALAKEQSDLVNRAMTVYGSNKNLGGLLIQNADASDIKFLNSLKVGPTQYMGDDILVHNRKVLDAIIKKGSPKLRLALSDLLSTGNLVKNPEIAAVETTIPKIVGPKQVLGNMTTNPAISGKAIPYVAPSMGGLLGNIGIFKE